MFLGPPLQAIRKLKADYERHIVWQCLHDPNRAGPRRSLYRKKHCIALSPFLERGSKIRDIAEPQDLMKKEPLKLSGICAKMQESHQETPALTYSLIALFLCFHKCLEIGNTWIGHIMSAFHLYRLSGDEFRLIRGKE